jgi:hypothetical protein
MKCPRCAHENPAASSVCLECGARLGTAPPSLARVMHIPASGPLKDRITRRRLVALVAALVVAPLAAQAQPRVTARRIGYLAATGAPAATLSWKPSGGGCATWATSRGRTS